MAAEKKSFGSRRDHGSSNVDVSDIFNANVIRERSREVFDYVASGRSVNFELNGKELQKVAEYVVETIQENYPDLNVGHHSRWRHFQVDGVDQAEVFLKKIESPQDKLRVSLELVIISVLLDAGAGNDWKFNDPVTGKTLNRSEGLGIASLRMFEDGAFSKNPSDPYRVDLEALKTLKTSQLEKYFQAGRQNPLVGVEGRTNLLKSLASSIEYNEDIFKHNGELRLGHMADFLVTMSKDGNISLHDVLKTVLYSFTKIWNGKFSYGEINLGDTWEHPSLFRFDSFKGLIPFHKLSQWLTYSMIEPLESYGLKVTEISKLTGLPEYRNGGLFLDMGVISWKDRSFPAPSYPPSSSVIVEWRAMTVVLLDMLAVEVRRILRKTPDDFPLTKVLEGGSWAAGRKIAKTLRPDDSRPPIAIVSDATVF